MKVVYAQRARDDIAEIYDSIAQHNPAAAQRVEDTIRVTCEGLTDFPYAYPATDEINVRRVPIVRFPYTIFYRIDAACQLVEIARVIHSSRVKDLRKIPDDDRWHLVPLRRNPGPSQLSAIEHVARKMLTERPVSCAANRGSHTSMSEPVRAILMDLEGMAVPMRFMTETLVPFARDRLGGYIKEHGEDEEVEEALVEAGRLMGGFSLKPAEAEALLQRWMKQDRKVPPLKFIQGLIWKEGYEAGAIKPELYPDVADSLKTWKDAGIRLFVYSSNSELAQKLLLGNSPAGDLTVLFEGFFDAETGQKIEPGSYTIIREKLGLPGAAILVLAGNEEELDAAREAGLATTRIVREGGAQTRHPVSSDLASLKLG